MKRMMALLLALVMLLALAACGGSAPAETTAPATVPENAGDGSPVTETEAPTLSPEEMLYNSLPDRMQQAVDLGIVELSQLEDPERECTVAEATQMLQNAYILRMYEAAGDWTRAAVSVLHPYKTAKVCNMLEKEKAEADLADLTFRPFEIKTVKISY